MARLIALIVLLLQLSVVQAYAHPGNTASDGCHYCRTNCEKWGEVAGARHCHGGAPQGNTSVAASVEVHTEKTVVQIDPTPTKKPYRKPVIIPTKTTTPTVTLTPTPTSTPTPTPKVTLTSTPQPTNTPKPTKTQNKEVKAIKTHEEKNLGFWGWIMSLFGVKNS